jgi:hypothetical protein
MKNSGYGSTGRGENRVNPAERAVNSGQRTVTKDPRSNVGNLSGGENQMHVRPPKRDSDISSTTQSGGPRSPGEKPGADDRR